MLKRLIKRVALICIILLFNISNSNATLIISKSSNKLKYKIGDTIENTIIYLENKSIDLYSISKNNYTYIDFWSTSEHQASNIALIASIANNPKYNNVKCISICLDNNIDLWKKMSSFFGIDWINAIDTNQLNSDLFSKFNINELPAGILINQEGVIINDKINSFSSRHAAFNELSKMKLKKTELLVDTIENFNAITNLTIIGDEISKYNLRLNNRNILEKVTNKNTIKINIEEPQIVTLINYDIYKDNPEGSYIRFYIDIGTHDVTIDLNNSTISSTTSLLNNEYNNIWKLKLKYDSLIRIAKYDDSVKNNKYGGINILTKSLDSITRKYHIEKFKLNISNPCTFNTLKSTLFFAQNFNSFDIPKSEIINLFNKLDKSLHNYPTYKETKKYLENDFIKINLNEKINTPLWKPE